LYLCRLRDPDSGEKLDEVLACFMKAPRSYTGEDMIELSAHGGALNLEQIVALLQRLGARLAEPGEFTRRAFLNGRMDLTQAEAVAEVIAARGDRALRNAQALLAGELGRQVVGLRREAIGVLADVESAIDFAEQDDTASWETQRLGQEQNMEGIEGRLRALAASYRTGGRLGGVSVALTGAVNAGKSSLLNALLGDERAVVSEAPGTTRDYLEAEVSWDGVPVTLVDLAGWREHPDELERQGVRLGTRRQQRCDLLLEVVDLAAPQQRCVVDEATLVAGNKVDLLDQQQAEARGAALSRQSGRRVALVSAKRATGLKQLQRAVMEELFGGGTEEAPQEGCETVVVTSARHAACLTRASERAADVGAALQADLPPELVAEHLREMLAALAEITGERYTEAVLDEVFSRFCLGK
jgi:tRNA modification GTPase